MNWARGMLKGVLKVDVLDSRIAAVAAGPSDIYKWRSKASQELLAHGGAQLPHR